MTRIILRVAIGLVVFNIGAAIAAYCLKRYFRTTADEWSDEVQLTAITEGLEFFSSAQAFRGGSMLVVMGGAEVDLSGARISPSGAELKVTTVLGGVEITVPESWNVEIEGTPVLGGHESLINAGIQGQERAKRAHGAPLLRIDATTVLGGLVVKSDTAAATVV